MNLFDTTPKNLPQPQVIGSIWYRGPSDTYILLLPPSGVLVYHRHSWARIDDTTGGSYKCTFVYADGTLCGTMWSLWSGLPLAEWAEKFFAAGPYMVTDPLPGTPGPAA